MAGVWRVVPGGQREYEDLVAGGAFVAVVEVTYELVETGEIGTVKVLKRDFTEDRVRAMIDAVAQEKARVARLEG